MERHGMLAGPGQERGLGCCVCSSEAGGGLVASFRPRLSGRTSFMAAAPVLRGSPALAMPHRQPNLWPLNGSTLPLPQRATSGWARPGRGAPRALLWT